MKSYKCWTWLIFFAAIIFGAAGCGETESYMLAPSSNLIQPDGTGPYPTIQAAISAAADGDTIQLADGFFTGAGNRDIDFQGKAITVLSKSGKPALCIIDCRGDAENPHRAFIFQNQEGQDSVIEGIGIMNGNVNALKNEFRSGGAILCLNASSPTLLNLIFIGNEARDGGGLACLAGSSPTVSDCVFEENHGLCTGGGIICSNTSSPLIEYSVFRDNDANDRGGAIHVRSNSAPTITNSRFEHNVSSYGGAIDGDGFTLTDCQFVGNTAPDKGGAIAAWGSVKINHCIMSRNLAGQIGGAVYFYGENIMDGCTLIGNEAGSNGSGVYCEHQSVSTITKSIIAFGKTREAVFGQSSSLVTIGCSDLYGNAGGDWTGIIIDQLGSNGNITADPRFCTSGAGVTGFCSLRDDSPCSASDCGMMGAVEIGCCRP